MASTIGRIAVGLATVSALTALAGVAEAATSTPASMSGPEGRALLLRSEALNEQYGLGAHRASAQGVTAAASSDALLLRSEALNEKYGLDKQKAVAVPAQPTTSTRGFAWGAFGIGAAAMFGLVLLAGGFFVGRRRLTTLPRARTSP